MKKKLRLTLAIILLLLIAAFVTAVRVFKIDLTNLTHRGHVTVNNLERNFRYHVPHGVSKHPKLIFVIHGSMGTPAIMQVSTGHEFDRLADISKDAIIVYPAGYHKYWNDCRKMATYDAKKENVDDVAFFGAMIGFFKEKYDIDPASVFATGFSNGGHMCYKLAKEKPQWFKGIAAVSANLPVDENNDCYETHIPVSILVMNGTGDPINPYNGGEVAVGDGKKRGACVATDQTIQYWLNNDSCTSTSTTYAFPDTESGDNSTVVSYLYKSATTGKQVELVKIINGGHIYPNPGFSLWPKQLGTVNKDINAPKVICDFFNGL